MKAAGLTNDQRMQVLTLTANEVSFDRVRQALRALFDDEGTTNRGLKKKGIWFNDELDEETYWQAGHDESWSWDEWAWEDESAMWGDWAWEPGWAAEPEEQEEHIDEEAAENPDGAEDALLAQEQEASALAAEAAKTLQEARQAIQRVRAARGYYPLGGKKGMGPSGFGKGKPSKGFGKGKSKAGGKTGSKGGCFICGRFGRSFRDCPGRFRQRRRQRRQERNCDVDRAGVPHVLFDYRWALQKAW